MSPHPINSEVQSHNDLEMISNGPPRPNIKEFDILKVFDYYEKFSNNDINDTTIVEPTIILPERELDVNIPPDKDTNLEADKNKSITKENSENVNHSPFLYVTQYCSNCKIKFTRHKQQALKFCKVCHTKLLFECVICIRRYKTKNQVLSHLKTKYDCRTRPDLHCSQCDYTSIHKGFLKNHLLKRHTGSLNDLKACSKCGRHFKRRFNVAEHELSCGKSPYLECSYCDFTTTYRVSFKVHLMNNHILDPNNGAALFDEYFKPITVDPATETAHLWNPGDSPETVQNKTRKDRESKKLTNKKKYIDLNCRSLIKMYCFKCKQTTPVRLIKHENCQKCETPLLHQCGVCRSKFNTYDNIIRHLKERHRNKDLANVYVCGICDRKYNNFKTVARHEHNCGRTYACNLCRFTARIPSMIRHHKEKWHVGPDCLENNRVSNSSESHTIIKEELIITDNEDHCNIVLNEIDNNIVKQVKKERGNNNVEITTNDTNLAEYRIVQRRNQIELSTTALINANCPNCNRSFKISSVITDKKKCSGCRTYLKYECRICKMQYKTLRHAYGHIEAGCDNFQPILNCAHCNYQTKERGNLQRHLKLIHSPTDPKDFLQCYKCKGKFKNNLSLKKHEQHCGMKPHVSCRFCPFKTKFKYIIRKHIRKQHKTDFDMAKLETLLDDIFEEGKKFQSNYRKTGKIIKRKETFSSIKLTKMYCCKCDQNFDKTVGINEDRCKICDAMLLFQCIKCSKSYKTYGSLHNHLRNVCGEVTQSYIKCHECDFKTINLYILRNHMKTAHSKIYLSENMLECSKCGKEYVRYFNLREHQQRCKARNRIKIQCAFCSYQTLYKIQMKNHIHTQHVDNMKNTSEAAAVGVNYYDHAYFNVDKNSIGILLQPRSLKVRKKRRKPLGEHFFNDKNPNEPNSERSYLSSKLENLLRATCSKRVTIKLVKCDSVNEENKRNLLNI